MRCSESEVHEMSEHKYYTIDTKVTGKQSFSSVKEVKQYLLMNWDKISLGRSDRYSVSVQRNLQHYGSFTRVGKNKLVRID